MNIRVPRASSRFFASRYYYNIYYWFVYLFLFHLPTTRKKDTANINSIFLCIEIWLKCINSSHDLWWCRQAAYWTDFFLEINAGTSRLPLLQKVLLTHIIKTIDRWRWLTKILNYKTKQNTQNIFKWSHLHNIKGIMLKINMCANGPSDIKCLNK